jgi:hypothetical protein
VVQSSGRTYIEGSRAVNVHDFSYDWQLSQCDEKGLMDALQASFPAQKPRQTRDLQPFILDRRVPLGHIYL